MSKYIDAEKLIERLEEMKRAEYENCGGVNSKTGALQEVQELIASLQQEQAEVEVERELRDYFSKWGSNIYNGAITMDNGIVVTLSSIQNVARHFYELGLNARKK